MATETANPLTSEQCDCLDRVQESIAITRALIAKCKDCGLPMEGREAENEQQAQIVAAIKRNFFPNRS